MPRSKKPELRFPVKLTLAQRKLVAEVVPAFGKNKRKNKRVRTKKVAS